MAVVEVADKIDTIYALATPSGRSAIAVIRITGTSIPKKLLAKLSLQKNSKGCFVRKIDLGDYSDKCLVLNFPAPESYTGEHLIEIHCHGNPVIIADVFTLLDGFGVEEASPGDFSKRAYLNGKVGLDEAESLMLGIQAQNKNDLISLEKFRSGGLGQKILNISNSLESLLVALESQLDFSDEDGVSDLERNEIAKNIERILHELRGLLKNYRPIRDLDARQRAVIIGPPNVGKSSLFNRLLKEDIAIVSNAPGTTRDVVRKTIVMEGIELEVNDTAGIRSGESIVEQEGIEKSYKALDGAEISIWVSDQESNFENKPKTDLLVMNKIDLFEERTVPKGWIPLSAKTGEGMNVLVEELIKKLNVEESVFYTSERIYGNMEKAVKTLSASSNENDFYEINAQNARDALILLKEIYGDFDNEKILDQIFQKFCIGK
tara:strand:- start:209 stop:1510 length:1302 start_codon:yes stop_codon:yes gene_type:complete